MALQEPLSSPLILGESLGEPLVHCGHNRLENLRRNQNWVCPVAVAGPYCKEGPCPHFTLRIDCGR